MGLGEFFRYPRVTNGGRSPEKYRGYEVYIF